MFHTLPAVIGSIFLSDTCFSFAPSSSKRFVAYLIPMGIRAIIGTIHRMRKYIKKSGIKQRGSRRIACPSINFPINLFAWYHTFLFASVCPIRKPKYGFGPTLGATIYCRRATEMYIMSKDRTK